MICPMCQGTGYRPARWSDGTVIAICQCGAGHDAAIRDQIRHDNANGAPHMSHSTEYSPYTHVWNVYDANGDRVTSYSHEEDARNAAYALDREAEDASARARGETPTPRPVVIPSADIVPHFETQPDAWQHTGTPDVLIIDASDPDQWQRYVWGYVRNSPAHRGAIHQHRVPARSCGYELGYYPVDVESWEMIPDGPYCAACVDPVNDYANPNPSAAHDYPQAYRAETIEQPAETDSRDGITYYTDARCTGCGEVLFAIDEDNAEDYPRDPDGDPGPVTRADILQGQTELADAYAAHLDAEIARKSNEDRKRS
jgi:hypothetical protein